MDIPHCAGGCRSWRDPRRGAAGPATCGWGRGAPGAVRVGERSRGRGPGLRTRGRKARGRGGLWLLWLPISVGVWRAVIRKGDRLLCKGPCRPCREWHPRFGHGGYVPTCRPLSARKARADRPFLLLPAACCLLARVWTCPPVPWAPGAPAGTSRGRSESAGKTPGRRSGRLPGPAV